MRIAVRGIDGAAALAMTMKKIARAALGDEGPRALEGGAWGASSVWWRQGTNAWRLLSANSSRLNMIKITPAIILSSASVGTASTA